MARFLIRLAVLAIVVSAAFTIAIAHNSQALATFVSSQKIALVPNSSGEGCCTGPMPTSGLVGGTSLDFGAFQFTDMPVSTVSAAALSGYDTLALLQVNTAEFTSQQRTDINSFVDNGGKLLIYDSDATSGEDYSWLSRPFSTFPPCPNCGLPAGTLNIVENNTLTSNDSTSQYYINAAEIPPNTDAVGDANVIQTSDPNWFGDMQATNGRGQTGWVQAYAESPSGKGVLIYNGLDQDWIGTTSYAASGIDWIGKLWYQELKQQWDPTGLPHSNPIAGNTATCGQPTIVSDSSKYHWSQAWHCVDKSIDSIAAPGQSPTCPVLIGTNNGSAIAGYAFNNKANYPDGGKKFSSCPPKTDFVLLEGAGPASPIPLPPVLLVPGFGGATEDTWKQVVQDLAGQFHVYAIQFSYPTGTMEPKAQALADAISFIRKANNNKPVAVVAHSDGGLITRFYLQGLTRSGYLNDVDRTIFLATPNGGVDYPFRDPITSETIASLLPPLPLPYTDPGFVRIDNGQWLQALEALHDLPTHVLGSDGGLNQDQAAFLRCIYYDTNPTTHECQYTETLYLDGIPVPVTITRHALPGGIAAAVNDGGSFIDYLNGHGTLPNVPRYEIYGLKKCYKIVILGFTITTPFCAADHTDGLVFDASATLTGSVWSSWTGTYAMQNSNHTSITTDCAPRAKVLSLLGGILYGELAKCK